MFQAIYDAITQHAFEVFVGFVFMVIGWLIGRWRAMKQFRKREFYQRLNVSFNSIDDGKLRIRTLMEKSAQEVFLNSVAVSQLLDAAKKTTVDDPIIPFDTDDYWYYLNAVLNEVSEKFAEGFLRRESGQSLRAVTYLICLTNECDGNLRTRKVRAMVIRRELLENLPEEMPQLEQPNHDTRWKTLKILAQRWQENPIQFKEIELLV